MRYQSLLTAALLLASMIPATLAPAGEPEVQRPYMLWTRAEADALRKRVESEPWAQARYTQMLSEGGRGGTFRNLFRYVVMGDQKAGESEKNYLVGIIGTHPRDFEKLEHGGRHYDCYLDALRYDAVHPLLTPDERKGIEDTFRAYIDYQLEDKKNYTRTSWLPNMQWPRVMSAHIMAAALNDRERLLKLIHGNGGWKYYLDSYITSDGFYMEEFGKHYSMIGEMQLFCRALERLGMNEWGYGYVGTGGATMRKYVESILLVGYPRTILPDGLPHYAKVTMGDARGNGLNGGPPYVFQHSIVLGHIPNRVPADDKAPKFLGGTEPYTGANMNGRDHKQTKVDKLFTPQWFELAHAQWPDAGFDYFLAQMRSPGQAIYTPSLFWGVEPIDPTRTKAPSAASYVSDQRGFAMLRAEESPAYWESPAPAVALQFGMYYVHYTRDCFSLLGFHAFNRPIYLNRGIADGYAGGDPWTDSGRGHCGLVVDNLPGAHVGQLPARTDFSPLVKFVAVSDDPRVSGGKIMSADNLPIPHDKTVIPGQVRTRALMLTLEYLFDVTRSSPAAGADPTPRTFDWQVHALGVGRVSDAWQATNELDGAKLYDATGPGADPRLVDKAKSDPDRYDLKNVRKLVTDQAVSAVAIQTLATGKPEESILGREWYDRKIGVRVHFLPSPGTTYYVGDTARYAPKGSAEPGKGERSTRPNEVGGTTLIARRTAPQATFVAVHEPFENDRPTLGAFTRIDETDSAVAASVDLGNGTTDRLLVRFDDKPTEPTTLSGQGESFTFTGHAFVRVTADQVQVVGNLTQMTLKVAGTPALLVNGKPHEHTVTAGVMTFK